MRSPSFTSAAFGRRRLLSSSAAVAGMGAALSACGSIVPAPGPNDPVATAINYVTAIASGLQDVINGIPSLSSLIGQNAYNEAVSIIGKISQVANTLSSVTTSGGAMPLVSAVLGYLPQVLSLLGVALPPPFDIVVPAVVALLPRLAALFGLTASHAPAMARRMGESVELSPEAAVMLLRSLPHSVPR